MYCCTSSARAKRSFIPVGLSNRWQPRRWCFVIRTSKNPLRSRPSGPLMATCLAVVAIGLYLPFSPLAGVLGFTPLPAAYFAFLAVATGAYLLLVEVAKRRLLRGTNAKSAVKHGDAVAVAA